jgi:hypothetical protein
VKTLRHPFEELDPKRLIIWSDTDPAPSHGRRVPPRRVRVCRLAPKITGPALRHSSHDNHPRRDASLSARATTEVADVRLILGWIAAVIELRLHLTWLSWS